MAKTTKAPRRNAPPRTETPGFWDRLPASARHGLALGVLVVVSLTFFAPLHFSGKHLVGGDTVQWRSMAQSMIAHQEQTGEPALWATNAFAGMPGYMISYATQVPQLDDLPRLLYDLLWPTSHFLILLVGMYLLLWYQTRNTFAGVLSAIAFGLTTYLPVILVAGHNSKFITLCWSPWLLLTFAYVLRQPKLLSALLFAVALAVNLRAGHVQITYYVAFLLGVWWGFEAIAAFRNSQGRAFGAATGWLVLGTVLGVLMVAQPYLAHAEYKQYTIRGAVAGGEAAAGLDWRYAMGWSQGVGELWTLLMADAYGGGGQYYWGPKPFTGGPHYVGGLVLLLSLLALWRIRRPSVYAFGLAALLMILFSLGEYFPALNAFMFNHFPLFNAFRVPETWLVAVALALATLAGFGLAAVMERETEAVAEQSATRTVLAATAGLVVLVLLLFGMKDAFFDFARVGERATITQQLAQANNVSPEDPRVGPAVDQIVQQLRDERVARFERDALRTLLFIVLAGAALALFRYRVLPGPVLGLVLAALVAFDLGGAGRRYLNEEVLVEGNSAADQIPRYAYDDFLLARQAEAGGIGHFRVLSLEGNPSTTARPSYHHESLGGYHGAKLRLYQDFLDQVLIDTTSGRINPKALDLMNTRYVVAQGLLPGMTPVFADSARGLVVLENPTAVPRAFFVGQTEVVPSAADTWARLRSAAFDPRAVALLPEAIPDFQPTPLDSASTAIATLRAYGPREIVLEVETDAPRLLVMSEVYYPAGWTATLDDQPVPIYRANYLLRAVPVPAGRHTLTMRFEPKSHSRGLWIAGGTTALVYGLTILLLGIGYRKRRNAG
jgi:hypothetical protein